MMHVMAEPCSRLSGLIGTPHLLRLPGNPGALRARIIRDLNRVDLSCATTTCAELMQVKIPALSRVKDATSAGMTRE